MQKLSKYLNYLILLLVVTYGYIYFFEASSAKQKVAEIKPKVDIDQVVNKFLKQTSEQTLKDQLAFKEALQKQLNKSVVIKRKIVKQQTDDTPASQQIWKDEALERSPAEQIQSEINLKQQHRQNEELDKEEYARQFIENARKNGFHVVLSSDYKVLSVTPIRKPTQTEELPELFPVD